jgi:hypothetical protein
MRATSAIILAATVLTGLATAMPSTNEIRSDGVQARTPLYGYVILMPTYWHHCCFDFLFLNEYCSPRPIRIAEPEEDEPAVIEARTPLYGQVLPHFFCRIIVENNELIWHPALEGPVLFASPTRRSEAVFHGKSILV